jgi:hypothetical protein
MQDAEVVKEALLTSAVSRAVAYLQLRHSDKPRPQGGYFAYFKKIGFALVYQAVCQDQVSHPRAPVCVVFVVCALSSSGSQSGCRWNWPGESCSRWARMLTLTYVCWLFTPLVARSALACWRPCPPPSGLPVRAALVCVVSCRVASRLA